MPLVVSLSGLDCQLLEECASSPLSSIVDRCRSRCCCRREEPGSCSRPPVLSWVVQRLQHRDALILHGFARGERRGRGFAAPAPPAPPREERGPGTALRLVAVTRRLAGVGLRTGAFVPSRWFASPGTITARCAGTGSRCARTRSRSGNCAPVGCTGLACTRSGRESAPSRGGSRALVMGRAHGPPQQAGRIAAEAADLRKPGARQALLDAVDLALHHRALPATYGEFGSDAQKIP